MPPERNTRSMVELPELLVSGLFHESDWPTLLGSVAFSRATLSNTIWLSEGERPRPKYPLNGMTWACAAERNSQVVSEANRQDRGQDFIAVPLGGSVVDGAPARAAAHQLSLNASLGAYRECFHYQIITEHTLTRPRQRAFYNAFGRLSRRTIFTLRSEVENPEGHLWM